jgi:hypothetical protein
VERSRRGFAFIESQWLLLRAGIKKVERPTNHSGTQFFQDWQGIICNVPAVARNPTGFTPTFSRQISSIAAILPVSAWN